MESLDVNYINCTIISEEAVNCSGNIYDLPEKRLTYHDKEFWIYIGIYTALVIVAGMMSGLTMGLLSMDITQLKVLQVSGTESEQRYARRILPLVSRHHLLLVTLLLANAASVEAMPIFLDRVSDPITAILVSVTAVLMFGDTLMSVKAVIMFGKVIPQALCTRYGLAIGALFSPVVYFLMGLLFIVAYPISKGLDCCLGKDHGMFFRRNQLKALVQLHGPEDEAANGSHSSKSRSSSEDKEKDEHLSIDEVLIIKGALDMKYKTASSAMMPIKDVYMLSMDARLDHETMTQIIAHGHSRIPVYVSDRNNVKAVLLTKRLIKLNPSDRIPVASLVDRTEYARPAMFVGEKMPLFDLLNQFQTGKSHLAMVRRERPGMASPGGGEGPGVVDDTRPLLLLDDELMEDADQDTSELTGLITLEDVLEELLQEEIEDEVDVQKMDEMGGLLRVAMAKVVNIQKNRLHRSKSQPQGANRLVVEVEQHRELASRQLSSSQPEEADHQHHSRSMENVTRDNDSDDPPLVTFT